MARALLSVSAGLPWPAAGRSAGRQKPASMCPDRGGDPESSIGSPAGLRPFVTRSSAAAFSSIAAVESPAGRVSTPAGLLSLQRAILSRAGP